jgi:hypothetical protein
MKLILLFILVINANANPIYSREFLRNQINQLKSEYIQEGVKYIENKILSLAKKGHTQYITEPVPDCVEYSKQYIQGESVRCERGEDCIEEGYEGSHERIFKDPKICEYIINEIYNEITKEFPDSNIMYNKKTRRYRIKW